MALRHNLSFDFKGSLHGLIFNIAPNIQIEQ